MPASFQKCCIQPRIQLNRKRKRKKSTYISGTVYPKGARIISRNRFRGATINCTAGEPVYILSRVHSFLPFPPCTFHWGNARDAQKPDAPNSFFFPFPLCIACARVIKVQSSSRETRTTGWTGAREGKIFRLRSGSWPFTRWLSRRFFFLIHFFEYSTRGSGARIKLEKYPEHQQGVAMARIGENYT